MTQGMDRWGNVFFARSVEDDCVWENKDGPSLEENEAGARLGGGASPVSCVSREKRRRTRAWRTWRKCQREPQGVFEFTMPNWPRLVLTSALWTMEWHLQPEDWSDLLSDVSNTQTLILRPPLNSHLSCPSTYLI